MKLNLKKMKEKSVLKKKKIGGITFLNIMTYCKDNSSKSHQCISAKG